MDLAQLDWPFFEERHRALAQEAQAWASARPWHAGDERDVDASCRSLVRHLGEAGWLRHAVAGEEGTIDTRAVCLLREVLAWHHGLADFAFAMQGLGSGAISLQGTPAQREQWLPRVARGEAIARKRTMWCADGGSFTCNARYPVFYGSALPDMPTLVSARRFRVGQAY